MVHAFDTEVAKQVGVKASIILQHFGYWHKTNTANGTNIIDGITWSFNSVRAFLETFDYLTPKEIRGSIDRLIGEGYIITGNHNIKRYDKTKWYALTEKGMNILNIKPMPKGQMDLPKGQMDLPKGQTYTRYNTDKLINKLRSKLQDSGSDLYKYLIVENNLLLNDVLMFTDAFISKQSVVKKIYVDETAFLEHFTNAILKKLGNKSEAVKSIKKSFV